MKTLVIVLAALLAAAPSRAAQKLRIVATVPELQEIVERIGGDHVSVDRLARGPEDIHQVVMRPSFATKLNRADAVVYLGLTLEHSFLPALLEVAVNPKLRPDPLKTCAGPGCVDCSEGVAVEEKPASVSRAEGEIHPLGNPHYNLDPENGKIIARNVAAGLSRIAPDFKADFDRNLKAYLAELEPKVAELKKAAAPLKGLKAVSYHKDIAYLARFTGLEFVDTIEVKPGVGPTPAHLAALVKKMKDEKVALIVREQHFAAKTPEWLAEQTGAKVAVIGVMAGALPGSETFAKLSERNVRALLDAAPKKAAP
jgi:zinc/manganese transport system substrate-binding protein